MNYSTLNCMGTIQKNFMEVQMVLVLKKFLKTSSLICPNNALKLNYIINSALAQNIKITLDFSNVKSISLAFLYFSFRGIKKQYKDKLKDLIVIKNPTSFLLDEIDYLKKNYRELSKKFNKFESENLALV